jgi:hypothetical protein
MEGMNSRRAWDMDIESRNTARTSGDMKVKRNAEDVKRNAPTVFTWIPGIKPVIVPQSTPKRHTRISSHNFNTKIISTRVQLEVLNHAGEKVLIIHLISIMYNINI